MQFSRWLAVVLLIYTPIEANVAFPSVSGEPFANRCALGLTLCTST